MRLPGMRHRVCQLLTKHGVPNIAAYREVCERRDTKGLYRKARLGELSPGVFMTLLLQPRIRRCNRRSRRSVGHRTAERTPPSFAAASARFAGVCAVLRRTFMTTP